MIQYNQRKIKLFNFFLAIVLMHRLRVVAIGSIHKSPHSVSVKTVVCHTSRVNTFRLHCLQYIMEDIFWSGTPYLESVGEHEPAVEELQPPHAGLLLSGAREDGGGGSKRGERVRGGRTGCGLG